MAIDPLETLPDQPQEKIGHIPIYEEYISCTNLDRFDDFGSKWIKQLKRSYIKLLWIRKVYHSDD